MSNGLKISLKSYDSIFQSEEQRNTEEIKPVPISELKPFTEQPFKVKLDEDMDALVESIKQCGVLTPVIARPHKDGGYEILSGHRRVKACELAGITDIPIVIKNLDDDTATILLVDSNLQREHILPSEKAFAYQMKLEAMKRQGARTDLTSSQIGTKLRSERKNITILSLNTPPKSPKITVLSAQKGLQKKEIPIPIKTPKTYLKYCIAVGIFSLFLSNVMHQTHIMFSTNPIIIKLKFNIIIFPSFHVFLQLQA